MALIKWDPFSLEPFDIDRYFEEFPSLISERTSGLITPAVDIYETKDSVVIESPLAGVKPEDVEVSVKENTLLIKGKTEEKKEVKDEDYFRREVKSGSIFRAVSLPTKVIAEKAQASSENGMLKVVIPKAEVKAPKKPIRLKITKGKEKKVKNVKSKI